MSAMPECAHKVKHRPRYHTVKEFHVGEETVLLCPGCHANVCVLLVLYFQHRGKPPSSALKRFTALERQLAKRAYQANQGCRS